MKMAFISTLILALSAMFSTNDTTKNDSNAADDCVLQLVGLECITPEGYAFPDAIYFKIYGEKWPSNRLQMTQGDYVDLEGYADIEFSGSIRIELWDDDTWDPDDFLGENTISCSYDSDGVVRFTEDGANYKLYYRVK